MLNNFHLNGPAIGFLSETQREEPLCYTVLNSTMYLCIVWKYILLKSFRMSEYTVGFHPQAFQNMVEHLYMYGNFAMFENL